MSSLSSTTPRLSADALRYLNRSQGPAAARLADALFTRLDTERQGYLRPADLAKALVVAEPAHGGARGAARAANLFGQLDRDGDGRLTQEEFSWSVTHLAARLLQRLKILHAPRDEGVAVAAPGDAQGAVVNVQWRSIAPHADDPQGTQRGATTLAVTAAAGGHTLGDDALLNQILRLARAYGVNDGRRAAPDAPPLVARA